MTDERSHDAAHRELMLRALSTAVQRLGVENAEPPRFGWMNRTVSTHVVRDRSDLWLRVVSEPRASPLGDWWTGNAASSAIADVPKPEFIDAIEWDSGAVRIKAELMTYVAARPISQSPELRTPTGLTPGWLNALHDSLGRLAVHDTGRVAVDSHLLRERLAGVGVEAAIVARWSTAHGDLHWANLSAPALVIFDWEGWGRAPYGLDAATLFVHSRRERH